MAGLAAEAGNIVTAFFKEHRPHVRAHGRLVARFDELFPVLKTLSGSPSYDRLIEDAEALRRAIASFHMEAIRFPHAQRRSRAQGSRG
jgi:hypothetical protein